MIQKLFIIFTYHNKIQPGSFGIFPSSLFFSHASNPMKQKKSVFTSFFSSRMSERKNFSLFSHIFCFILLLCHVSTYKHSKVILTPKFRVHLPSHWIIHNNFFIDFIFTSGGQEKFYDFHAHFFFMKNFLTPMSKKKINN